MFCSSCGADNDDDASYCSNCGKQLGQTNNVSGTADPDIEYLETAIGPKNTNYYITRFQTFERDGGWVSWNWPAFFVSLFWLLYRKMWAYAVGYFFLPTIFNLVVYIVLLVGIDEGSAAVGAMIANLAAVFIVFPMFANALYFRLIRKRIAEAKAGPSDRERQLRSLAATGGTSNGVLVILAIFLPVVLIGILAGIAIPAYQDYTIRAQVSEGLSLATGPKAAVAETILGTGQVPGDRGEAGLITNPRTTSGRYVQSVDVVGGRIDITYGNEANHLIAGEVLSITPYLEEHGGSDRTLHWRCGYAPVPKQATQNVSEYIAGTIDPQFLPSSCRPKDK